MNNRSDLIERLHARIRYLQHQFRALSSSIRVGGSVSRNRSKREQSAAFDEWLILGDALEALSVRDRGVAERFLEQFKRNALNDGNPPLAQEAAADLALMGIPTAVKNEARHREIVLTIPLYEHRGMKTSEAIRAAEKEVGQLPVSEKELRRWRAAYLKRSRTPSPKKGQK
jgi:hypothetical protein